MTPPLTAVAAKLAARGQTPGAASDCRRKLIDADVAVKIRFAHRSTDLTEAGRNALDLAAAHLACDANQTALIVSLGDAHRLAAYRREIAERRAEVIAERLGREGVAQDRIERAPPDGGTPAAADGVLLIEALGPDV